MEDKKENLTSSLRRLFRISRILRDDSISPTALIELLFSDLKGFTLSSLKNWDSESLRQSRVYAEDIIPLYVGIFYDPSLIPVTYYKREKAVRRFLDNQFSSLFAEIRCRSGQKAVAELILKEPIYFLLQKSRERSFPKGPKSKNRRPHLATLKIRFHLELARRLDSNDEGADCRKILLPYEI